MSVLAKLISLEAIKILDPEADRLTISLNPGEDKILSVEQGNKFLFEFSLRNRSRTVWRLTTSSWFS